VRSLFAGLALSSVAWGAPSLDSGAPAFDADDPQAPPNFVDNVQPILRASCTSCHRGSRAKNGLDVTSVAKLLSGGSSGAAIVPGDPDGSLLLQVIEHTREPFMPPDEDQLDEASRATLRAWILGGARLDAADPGKPAGAPPPPAAPTVTAGAAPMPPAMPVLPHFWSDRPEPVTALGREPRRGARGGRGARTGRVVRATRGAAAARGAR
jgi:hypothetical protein